jgi:hypothetical protein
MLKTSTKQNGPRRLTSSAEDSPASHSARQEKEKASQTKDIYGPSLSASFAKFAPDGSLLKMSQGCLQLTLEGHLEGFSGPWPNAGTLLNGILYQRQASGRYIPGIELSSWPTPTATNRESTLEQYKKRRELFGGTRRAIYLQDAVKYWPTPTVQDSKNNGSPSQMRRNTRPLNAEVKWRTPCGSDGNRGAGSGIRAIIDGQMTRPSGQRVQIQPDAQAQAEYLLDHPKEASGGSLNPTWVEWLMGYELGWTDLDDLEIPLSLKCPNISANSSSNMKEV